MYKKFLKRFFDISLSGFALIMLSPILFLVSILIKIKLGSPVIYTAKRPGKDGIVFNLHKFRSMTNDCDENGDLLPDSQRLTKFGRFLRKTSIDELPELWDVFVGKMSLIGPRPLSPIYLPYYTEYESKRHEVRPGITGLAQINGRSGLNWEQRFEYDIYYVNKLNFMLDFRIFFRTVYKVLKRADTLERDEISLLNFNEYRENQWKEKLTENHEIGSEFFLTGAESGDGFLNKFAGAQYVMSGRTALDYIAKDLKAKNINSVLLPSYLCESIIVPFKNNGFKIKFYEVYLKGFNFTAETDNVSISENTAILICDYFFFDKKYYDKLIKFAKTRRLTVIHDITHSLLSENLSIKKDDYYFASLRKWLAVPDGALFVRKDGEIDINSATLNDEFYIFKNTAMSLKRDYIQNGSGDKEEFRKAFKKAEGCLENNFENKSVSKEALDKLADIDFQKIIAARKFNSKRILEGFKNLPLKVLHNDNCPLFIPVFFKDEEERDGFQKYMADKKIYLPIHWPLFENAGLSERAKGIYDTALSIVIDQRYSAMDMHKIIKEANNFFEGKA